MKRLWIAVCLLLFVFQVEADEIEFENCSVLRIFVNLWEAHPLGEREAAAWIIEEEAGQYSQIEWAYTPQRNLTVWSDKMPKNVAAQVHTHGDRLNARPSEQDISVARKYNIPVYVLSRKNIWRASPDGAVTRVAKGSWFRSSNVRCSDEASSVKNR